MNRGQTLRKRGNSAHANSTCRPSKTARKIAYWRERKRQAPATTSAHAATDQRANGLTTAVYATAFGSRQALAPSIPSWRLFCRRTLGVLVCCLRGGTSTCEDQSPADAAGGVRRHHLWVCRSQRRGSRARQLAVQAAPRFIFLFGKRQPRVDAIRSPTAHLRGTRRGARGGGDVLLASLLQASR